MKHAFLLWGCRRGSGGCGQNDAAEGTGVAKVIDVYVRAYQTAELDELVARMEESSDAELMRVAPKVC